MITNARFVCLSTNDQDKALVFYRDSLGFEVRTDVVMNPETGARWIELAPPTAETYFVLALAEGDYKDQVGRFGPVWFQCDDLDATYEDLSGKGVEFGVTPTVAYWDPSTRWAQFADPDGNTFGLSATIQY